MQANHVPDLTIESVGEHNLRDQVITKMKGFANSETEPAPDKLKEELANRTKELASIGRSLLGRIKGEPTASLGWYETKYPYISHLATRVPFRKRGIARHLLSRMVADSLKQGKDTVIISANHDNTPIQFYRRFGFTDEVYWWAEYEYKSKTK